MEWLKIADVAQSLGVSKAAVYKKIESSKEKLTAFLRQEGGKTFVSEEGVELLRQGMRQKKGTLWDQAPADQPSTSTFNQPSTPDPKLTATFNQVVEELKTEIRQKNQTVDRLLTQIEEDRRRQAEERQRTDSIIMKLAHDLEDTRRSALAIEMKVNTLLEKPADPIPEILTRPAPPVRPWTPPAGKSPAENMGLLERFWTGIVHPERLRRHAEN